MEHSICKTSSSDYAAPLSAVSVLQFLPLNHASRKKLNRQTAISVMQFDNNIRKYRGTEVVWRKKIDPPSLIRGTGKVMKKVEKILRLPSHMEKDIEVV